MMGYTHEWRIATPITPLAWHGLATDAWAITLAAEAPRTVLLDASVTAEAITLNGVGTDGCETLDITRDTTSFACCKTGRNPYDAAVCAVLIALAHHAGDAVNVSSDGDVGDWQPGVALYRAATGRDVLPPRGPWAGPDAPQPTRSEIPPAPRPGARTLRRQSLAVPAAGDLGAVKGGARRAGGAACGASARTSATAVGGCCVHAETGPPRL